MLVSQLTCRNCETLCWTPSPKVAMLRLQHRRLLLQSLLEGPGAQKL